MPVPKLVRVFRWDEIARGLGLQEAPNPETRRVRLLGRGGRTFLCVDSDWLEVFDRCAVFDSHQRGDISVDFVKILHEGNAVATPAGIIHIDDTDAAEKALRLEGGRVTEIRALDLALVQFGKYVIAVFKKRGGKWKAFITSPIERRLVKHNGEFKLTQSSVSALILLVDRKGRARKAYAIDKLLGRASVFELPRCIYVDSECGSGLCVIYCKEVSYAVNADSIHPIPNGLKPLISCSGKEYYLDIENGLLTVYRDGVLEPLIDEKPFEAACAGDGVLINCADGVRMLMGNTSVAVSELPVYEIGGSKSSIMYGISGSYTIINLESGEKAYFKAFKCVLTENDTAWCITRDGLAVLSATEFAEPVIDVIRSRVDAKGYAIVSLHPWFEGCRYRVEGPVDVVASITAGNALRLTLRPRRLGWCGNVPVIFESPIFTIEKDVYITSSEPTLKKLEVVECSYAPDGRLVKHRECNFRALIKVRVKWPDPRSPEVVLKASKPDVLARTTVLSSRRWEVDYREFEIEAVGNHRGLDRPLVLNVTLRAGSESYPIGKASIPLSKYVLRNPLGAVEPALINDGDSTVIKSAEGAIITVTCSDGRLFEGRGSVNVVQCLEPALVKEVVRRSGFEWVRERIINCSPSLAIRSGNEFSTTLIKHGEGGLICVDPIINLPSEHRVECAVNNIMPAPAAKSGGSIKVEVHCKASAPSYVLVSAGKGRLVKLGWMGNSFNFTVGGPLPEMLASGIKVYSATLTGRTSATLIRGKDLLAGTLYKCYLIAGSLLKSLKGRERCQELSSG